MTRKMFNDPPGFRHCRKCKKLKWLTSDFFHKNNRNALGFCCYCKVCENANRSEQQRNKVYYNYKRHCKECGSFFWACKRAIRTTGAPFCSVECSRKSPKNPRNKGCSWNGARQGEGNPAAKLTVVIVREIKAAIASGETPASIAAKYHVSYSNVTAIKSGRSWAHI